MFGIAGKIVASTLVCLSLAAGGAVAANADTLPSQPAASDASASHAPSTHVSGPRMVSPHASTTKLGSTLGWNITNGSSEILVFQKTDSDLPAPNLPVGGVWYPGQKLNFQLASSFVSDNAGDAIFTAELPDGSNAGTVRIHLDSMAGGSGTGSIYWNGTQATAKSSFSQSAVRTNLLNPQYPTGAYELLPNQNNMIEDNGAMAWNLDSSYQLPAGATEGALLQNLCNAAGTNACKYQGDAKPTPGMGPKEPIAVAFDNTQGDTSDGTLTTQSGWSTSETNSYQMNVSAGTTLFDAINLGVEQDKTTSFTTENNFSTSLSTNLFPQQTSVIFAQAPVYDVYGTFTITLGNTNWTFYDSDFQYPRANGVVSYDPQRFNGDVTSQYTVDSGVNGSVAAHAPLETATPAN